MSLFSLFAAASLVAVGYLLDYKLNLFKLYITPPVAGGLIGISLNLLIYFFTGRYWLPSAVIIQLLITLFLFSIGVKIGFIYTKQHLINLVKLFLISIGIILMIDVVVNCLFVDQQMLFAFSSSTFAWNEEWMRVVNHVFASQSGVNFYFYASLVVAFLVSPVALCFFNYFSDEPKREFSGVDFASWQISAVSGALFFTALALIIKAKLLVAVPFLFGFIVAMWLGVGVGISLRKLNIPNQKKMILTISQFGLLALYGFIVLMLFKSVGVVIFEWQGRLMFLLLIKVIIITSIHVLLSKWLVSNRQNLVVMGACWAFTLSAPVACMNAMNSVVRAHGEADDVLLLVPPLILWLINYVHYLIFVVIYL